MQLLLIRHGIAVDPDKFAATGAAEPERPLTDRGVKRAKRAARGLRRTLDQVDLIATSPFRRAVQTAKVFSKMFAGVQVPEIVTIEALAPGSEPQLILEWLQQHDAQATIALVGHEPDMSRLTAFLTTGGSADFTRFGKAGAALVRCPNLPAPGNMELVWLLSPPILRRLGV